MNTDDTPDNDSHSGLKELWGRQKHLILFIVIMAVILAIIVPPVSHSNSYYFKKYPVNVSIEVEEPLSVEAARTITLMALKSMNHTFGYDMNLVSAVSFPDDDVEVYEHEAIISGFKKSFLRLSSELNNEVKMKIKFYYGLGPESEDGTMRAVGSSNWGSTISLYFSESYEIIQFDEEGYLLEPGNGNKQITTIIHEFGHALGLEHNIESPIMHTINPEENPENVPRPGMNIRNGAFSMQRMWNATMHPDEVADLIQSENHTGPIDLYKEDSGLSHIYIFRDQDFDNITMLFMTAQEFVYDNETFWQVEVGGHYFHLLDYANGWTSDEIQEIT